MFWFYFELIVWILWQIPQNIIALIMLPFLGKKKCIRFENYAWVFECENMAGGISLGNFIFIDSNIAKNEAHIRHELGHTIQSHILGPVYLLVIGLPSLLWAAFTPKNKCYYDFYTESWANNLAGVKMGRNQYSCYIYLPKEND